jgi:hypothetical protein
LVDASSGQNSTASNYTIRAGEPASIDLVLSATTTRAGLTGLSPMATLKDSTGGTITSGDYKSANISVSITGDTGRIISGGTSTTTDGVARFPNLVVAGTAGTNAIAGWRINLNNWSLGIGGSIPSGGFYAVFRFGVSDATTNGRIFVGMSSATGAPTSVEPSTLTNVMGVGCGTANTNLYFYYGGSAAQTPINLGASFPSQTANTDLYELILHAGTDTWTEVDYKVTRLNTGEVAAGSVTAATAGTQLPANTTFLSPRMWRATAGTSGTPQIDISNFYIESDY